MPLTKSKATEAFIHILDNVFEAPADGPLSKAFEHSGYSNIWDLITLTDDDIESLTYDSDKQKEVPLGRAYQSMLRIFCHYCDHQTRTGAPIGDDWTAVTADSFNDYRTGPDYAAIRRNGSPLPTPLASSTPQPARTTPSPVEIFKRGIKRDPALFMPFKDGKMFDSWQRSTLAQARAQDVADILDPNYVVPSIQADKDLFSEKQKYMFAVFERTLLTDVGKSFVRDHENDGNAREVYKKVVDYYLKSTKASLDSSGLLSYITSIRLGSGLWKGSTHSFILHWQDQVRMYEKQVHTTEHFPQTRNALCSRMQCTL